MSFIGIEPNLSLATVKDRGSKTFLGAQVNPGDIKESIVLVKTIFLDRGEKKQYVLCPFSLMFYCSSSFLFLIPRKKLVIKSFFKLNVVVIIIVVVVVK